MNIRSGDRRGRGSTCASIGASGLDAPASCWWVRPLSYSRYRVMASAAAPRPVYLFGGSVSSGTYATLTITGFCQVDSGLVSVVGSMTVNARAGLLAVAAAQISRSAVICPSAITGSWRSAVCRGLSRASTTPAGSSHDRIRGNVVGSNALMMLVHNNLIAGEATQTGGGGRTCHNFPLGPDGPPAYSTWEDNASVTTRRSWACTRAGWGSSATPLAGASTTATTISRTRTATRLSRTRSPATSSASATRRRRRSATPRAALRTR